MLAIGGIATLIEFTVVPAIAAAATATSGAIIAAATLDIKQQTSEIIKAISDIRPSDFSKVIQAIEAQTKSLVKTMDSNSATLRQLLWIFAAIVGGAIAIALPSLLDARDSLSSLSTKFDEFFYFWCREHKCA